MSYEWEEEVPQPKPPTVRVRLMICGAGPNGGVMDHPKREATRVDIARALGVTEGQLANFVELMEQRAQATNRILNRQALYQQDQMAQASLCAYCNNRHSGGSCGGNK